MAAGDYAYAAPGHLWGEPRHAAAVAALRELRSDGALPRSRTGAAQAWVLERHSLEAAAWRYAARLGEILAGRPVPERVVQAPAIASVVNARRTSLFARPGG